MLEERNKECNWKVERANGDRVKHMFILNITHLNFV